VKTKRECDPREIFNHACRFLSSDQLLRKIGKPGSGWELAIAPPAMVLSSFAAELFLKSLLVLEKGEAPPTHRLDTLFKRVSHKRQRRIQELWEADARPKIMQLCQSMKVPSDLSNALVKCGSAFENLRYYYEKPEVNYYIGDFAWIVMRVIVELKPEWTPQETPPVRL
jgi:hypothetical protein